METPQLPAAPKAQSALELLIERFNSVPDFRCGNDNQVHLLIDILVSAICAVLGGANSYLSVPRFVACHESWFRTFLLLPGGVPSHDTSRRIFEFLDPAEWNSRFASWMQDISGRLGLKHLAIDGKTLCGSGGGRTGLTALHMVHAFAVENGVCLAQQATDAKSNEITAIPQLLSLLDLKGAIVTIDAMGCPKEIAAQIVNAKGDYLLAVKGNQERLHDDVKAILDPLVSGTQVPNPEAYKQTEESNRGRQEKRTCYTSTDVSTLRDLPLWQGLKAVGVIIGERVVNGKKEVETRYFISSRVLSVDSFMQAVRDHWTIENGLHWVLDVVFGEDTHQLRTGNGAHNFTTLRKLTHALIKNSNPKHGIKGTREMAGWNPAFLEETIRKSTIMPEIPSA